MKYLVIVESPAKCKKIQSYLGKDYKVVASVGHFRDLSKKDMGIDIHNNYKPTYVITKNKVVKDLRKFVRGVDKVIIATDQDREGEAIGYHLCQVLKLDLKTTDRMVRIAELREGLGRLIAGGESQSVSSSQPVTCLASGIIFLFSNFIIIFNYFPQIINTV